MSKMMRKIVQNELHGIDGWILTAYQPVYGYFMPRIKGYLDLKVILFKT